MLRKCFVLLLLLILVGCNVSPIQTAVLSTPLPPAPKPTNTIQLQTVTPRPSATNSLSLTAMAVPTITSTPAPTLTANERQALVRKLLLDNGGCELPCWWGITPGTTTLQTAKDLLTSQGIKWFRDNELHFDPPLSERSVGYRVDLYFVQRAEYMQSIQVQSEVLGDPQTNHFAEDWRRYSLDQVLTRYGIPTQIWLGIGPVVEQGAKLGYVLTVVYNEGGFSVSYGGTAISDQLKDQVCPVFDEVDHIILRLQSPQSDDSIFRPDPDAYIRPLEEATKMSVEQFHQSFVQPNSKTCLETPADMW